MLGEPHCMRYTQMVHNKICFMRNIPKEYYVGNDILIYQLDIVVSNIVRFYYFVCMFLYLG